MLTNMNNEGLEVHIEIPKYPNISLEQIIRISDLKEKARAKGIPEEEIEGCGESIVALENLIEKYN